MKNLIVIKSIASLVSFLEDQSVDLYVDHQSSNEISWKRLYRDTLCNKSLAAIQHMVSKGMIGVAPRVVADVVRTPVYHFTKGDQVKHTKFGKGVVEEHYNPSSIEYCVGVKFEGIELMRWFTKDGTFGVDKDVELSLDVPINEYALAE